MSTWHEAAKARGCKVLIDRGVGTVVGEVIYGFSVRLDADGTEWLRTDKEIVAARAAYLNAERRERTK